MHFTKFPEAAVEAFIQHIEDAPATDWYLWFQKLPEYMQLYDMYMQLQSPSKQLLSNNNPLQTTTHWANIIHTKMG